MTGWSGQRAWMLLRVVHLPAGEAAWAVEGAGCSVLGRGAAGLEESTSLSGPAASAMPRPTRATCHHADATCSPSGRAGPRQRDPCCQHHPQNQRFSSHESRSLKLPQWLERGVQCVEPDTPPDHRHRRCDGWSGPPSYLNFVGSTARNFKQFPFAGTRLGFPAVASDPLVHELQPLGRLDVLLDHSEHHVLACVAPAWPGR